MKMTKTITTEREVTICDLCGEPMDPCSKPCVGCGRDACPMCAVLLDGDPMTCEPNYVDGHAFPVCKQCFGVTCGYSVQATQLVNKHRDEVESLRREWQEACKKAIK